MTSTSRFTGTTMTPVTTSSFEADYWYQAQRGFSASGSIFQFGS
jgi:hypothetical protein